MANNNSNCSEASKTNPELKVETGSNSAYQKDKDSNSFDINYDVIEQLQGISPEYLFTKILDAIDKGISTKALRENPIKYIVSGKTKKIVINYGGEGLKVSYNIIKEMAKRGDELAIKLLQENKFKEIYLACCKKESTDPHANKWTYLERKSKNYDRENKILIEILEEGKLDNIGGWVLQIEIVGVEPWSYKVCKSDDMFGSEYIEGIVHDEKI